MHAEDRPPVAEVILVVEDDPNDVLFITRALKHGNIDLEVRHARDGEEAVAYLKQCLGIDQRAGCPIPRLVICDIRMPKLDGFEVLKWIRSQPQLARVPVVMLSSSDRQEDIATAVKLGANHYIMKHPLFTALPMHIKPLLIRANRPNT